MCDWDRPSYSSLACKYLASLDVPKNSKSSTSSSTVGSAILVHVSLSVQFYPRDYRASMVWVVLGTMRRLKRALYRKNWEHLGVQA